MKRLAPLALLLASLAAAQEPHLGGGVEGIADWSRSDVYADLIKQSRGFFVSVPGQSDRPARTDADGWPTEDCSVIVQTVNPGAAASGYAGTYKLSFRGRATVDQWWSVAAGGVSNVRYDAATDTTTADVRWSPTATSDGYFVLRFTGVTKALRDLRLLRPGVATTNPPLFTKRFLDHARKFGVIRCMDWTATNFNPVVRWADRNTPNRPSAASPKGAPWEHCIALANETDRDLWVNLPAKADNDYVRRLARLLRDTLEPGRKVYVEYSNEVWNWGFGQFNDNRDLALAEVNAGGSDLQFPGETEKNGDGTWKNQWDFVYRRIGKRLYVISRIFASEWGEAAINDRVRPVLANQVANPYTHFKALEWMRYKGYFPGSFWYALAGAPYFNVGSLDDRKDATATQVLDALAASIADWSTPGRDGARKIEELLGMARSSGLRLLAYEGGPDTFGPNNVAAKKTASHASRMQTLCETYLRNWYAMGGDLFEWFVIGATNWDSPYGTWGLTDDMRRQDAAKIRAMDAILAAPQPAPTLGHRVSTVWDAGRWAGAALNNSETVRWLGKGDGRNYLFLAAPGDYAVRVDGAADVAGAELGLTVDGRPAGLLRHPVRTGGWDAFSPTDYVFFRVTTPGQHALRLEGTGRAAIHFRSVELRTRAEAYRATAWDLRAEPAGSRRVRLTWRPPTDGADTYVLLRDTAPIPADSTTAYRTGIRGTTFVDTVPRNGVVYHYRVAAVKGGVRGGNSQEVQVTPFAPNLLRNPGFESGDFAGVWWGGGDPRTVVAAAARTGSFGYRQAARWGSLYQDVTGLTPNKGHTLVVYARATGTSARLYAEVGGVQTAVPIKRSSGFYAYRIRFRTNAEGKARVAVEETAGTAVQLDSDDWSLTED